MTQRPAILVILVLLLAVSHANATPMRLIGALRGDSLGDQLGNNCEGIGDVNGDGYNDFLMTVRHNVPGAGELRLYLGGTHPFNNPPAVIWPNIPLFGNGYGYSPFNIGDVDCDGIDDFVCGFGSYYTDTLKLIAGLKDQDQGDQFVIHIDTNGFETTIGGGGDNNHDGRPEFWVNWNNTVDDTIINAYIGCDLLDTVIDHRISWTWAPGYSYRHLGRELCTTCDLNGDSIPEVIYGQYGNLSSDPGRVCIIWGREYLSSIPDLNFYAPTLEAQGYQFGTDLACLGDISGDGVDDLWVSQGIRNYIYFGGQPFDTIPDIALDWSHGLYADIENVGDINNDCWNDLMFVESADLGSTISYIYCYPGMDTLVDVLYRAYDFESYLPGVVAYQVGRDHSWAGDVDGDGINDVLIGMRDAGTDEGTRGLQLVQAGWDSIPTDVSSDTQLPIPSNLELEQNQPNPFNSSTTIRFFLRRSGYTELKIYNLLGEVVAEPIHQVLSAGDHQILWNGFTPDGKPAASGIYFYRLTSGPYSDTRKMMLMK
ncbi:MAG: T9SS type A sorting domain-containing protein [candidate division Zixibacteria bacterium]|nr:T9SS type A sorting domain-containing protein [candidate division Zixibacteria bacterium]